MVGYVTSIDGLGSRMAAAWGGAGNGSWIYTKLPQNTAIHPNTAQAVADIVAETTGFKPLSNPPKQSYPTWNTRNFTATVNVVPVTQPYVPVRIRLARILTSAFEQGQVSMARAGVPIPDGVEPTIDPKTGTADSDGTIVIYQPDWKWPGRPADPQYWGRYYEIWGAVSPAQNVALGNASEWTAKQVGRVCGASTRKNARVRNYYWQTDPINATNPDFIGPITTPVGGTISDPNAPKLIGYGKEGVAEQTNFMITAAHLPFAHSLISLRDLTRTDPQTGKQGYIDHALGFLMYTYSPQSPGVWPASGYDASSRAHMPHGSRLRFPANYPTTAPSTVPSAYVWVYEMLVKALRDYGMFFYDTHGGDGMVLRAEPGCFDYLPAGFVPNTLMKLIPWKDMQMLVVGTDTQFNVTTTVEPADTLPPTIASRNPSGTTLVADVNTNIDVTFSESVQGVSGTTFVLTHGDTGATIPASVSGAGASWTLNPTGSLANDTPYLVTLTGGASAIRDLAGNPLATETWAFRTVTSVPLKRVRRSKVRQKAKRVYPIDGTTMIDANTVITEGGVFR